MNANLDDINKIDTDFRFAFGKNWKKYVRLVSDDRLQSAMDSLKHMLNEESLAGKTFVDVGCGSGLFSLAALKLGAKQVLSIDYDENSVNCAKYLNNKYGPFDNWRIEQGSILNNDLIKTFGEFDYVYSWGVLHHTGDMWKAFENVIDLIAPNGVLFITIYNDQFLISRIWKKIKYIYNKSPRPVQFLMGNFYFLITATRAFLTDIVNGRSPLNRYRSSHTRGMNAYYDAIDWIGGYPFEVAEPGKIFGFYRDRGFELIELLTRNGPGCNEFVFRKKPTKE
ncbi:class I SAM-dependent methyltransferase [Kaarinaea lacus]